MADIKSLEDQIMHFVAKRETAEKKRDFAEDQIVSASKAKIDVKENPLTAEFQGKIIEKYQKTSKRQQKNIDQFQIEINDLKAQIDELMEGNYKQSLVEIVSDSQTEEQEIVSENEYKRGTLKVKKNKDAVKTATKKLQKSVSREAV